jgi:hypothetical protein
MRDAIAALGKVGNIRQIHDGRWLFKALLAPKPHQEHVRDIGKFVWPFCVNYIPLNSVTWIIAYPISRCNSAINEEFGQGAFFWLWDASMGYHQLDVALASQEKLAFEEPNAIKWTYIIMPFGPTTGPATFITFIHNIDSQWKAMAQQTGLIIDDNTNHCQQPLHLGKVTLNGIDLHRVPTLCVPGLPAFIEFTKESHLSQALQLFWNRCLF